MAINANQVVFVKNIYFTDETNSLSLEWTKLGGFPAVDSTISKLMPDTIAFGMSTQAPSDFSESSMEIPFETVNPYNADGTYYSTYTWNIAKYQETIRGLLTAYKTTEIYVYSKGTKGESEYINWTLCYVSIADINAVPIFIHEPSYRVTDSLSTGLTGNTSTVIRYVSDTTVSFACQAQKSSLLKAAAVKIGSTTKYVTYSNVSSASSDVTIADIDGEVFNVTITDSRGFRTMHSVAVERYIKYFYPTCNLTVTNPTVSGGSTTLTADGLCFNGSFGAVANTITVQYRYKTTSGSYGEWRQMTVTRDGSQYTATATVSGLDYQTKYSFQARITDQIASVSSGESIAKSQPVFSWGEGDFVFSVPVRIGRGLEVGQDISAAAVKASSLQTNSAVINGPTNITGSLTLNGETITSFESQEWEVGSWTPVCNACSSPQTAVGHYFKAGTICIINFYYEGTTTTFLGNNYLYFSGLPYAANPAIRWYGGGGTASGVSKASSTEYFSGWNIESNKIYGRTVKGNTSDKKTINYNGTASSYTFYYDTGAGYLLTGFTGQKIYCSGTIAYRTA